MNFFSNFFISIDQLGNVIALGNPDNTISARVGYYNRHFSSEDKAPWQWRVFEYIIDFAFYPIDGGNHCHEAYHNDAGEIFDKNTNNIIVAILALIIVPSCVVIATLLYTLYLFGIVSPKKIDRNENIKYRLKIAKAKLDGTLHELNEHKVEVDDELKLKAKETITAAEAVSEKINGMLNLLDRVNSQA